MPASPTVLVRFPERGEVLTFRPTDPVVAWFLVHRAGALAAPCTEAHCLGCRTGQASRVKRWEGYLCGFEQGPCERPMVLRLNANCWAGSLAAVYYVGDLRSYTLTATRMPGAGHPRVGLTLERTDLRERPPHDYTSDVLCYLHRWWMLPEAEPAYRREVWDLQPRVSPKWLALTIEEAREKRERRGVEG
jgi:hypothetical protein